MLGDFHIGNIKAVGGTTTESMENGLQHCEGKVKGKLSVILQPPPFVLMQAGDLFNFGMTTNHIPEKSILPIY